MKIISSYAAMLIIVAFVAGASFTSMYHAYPPYENASFIPSSYSGAAMFKVPNKGFIPANVSITGAHITLRGGCYTIEFDVTNDQAYSITNALEGTQTSRPLTHDILRDIMENYNITILNIRIERFGNDIYYARMFTQHGSDVLDVDMRPSDAIALSLKTGNALYINETMLKEKGTYVC